MSVTRNINDKCSKCARDYVCAYHTLHREIQSRSINESESGEVSAPIGIHSGTEDRTRSENRTASSNMAKKFTPVQAGEGV